jgi:hypothetical protein
MKVQKNTFIYYVMQGERGVVIHLHTVNESGQPYFFSSTYSKSYWDNCKSKEGWLLVFLPNTFHTYKELKDFDPSVDSIFKFSELFYD